MLRGDAGVCRYDVTLCVVECCGVDCCVAYTLHQRAVVVIKYACVDSDISSAIQYTMIVLVECSACFNGDIICCLYRGVVCLRGVCINMQCVVCQYRSIVCTKRACFNGRSIAFHVATVGIQRICDSDIQSTFGNDVAMRAIKIGSNDMQVIASVECASCIGESLVDGNVCILQPYQGAGCVV